MSEILDKKVGAIWKTPLPIEDEFELYLPEDAEIVSVQTQNGNPCIWYVCDPAAKLVTRNFRTVGTGHPFINEDMKFIGTYQLEQIGFVGHLFEIENG